MAAVLLALAASLSWGISDFFGGILSRRVPVLAILALSQLAGFAFVIGLVLVRATPVPGLGDAAWAALAGACGVVGIAALYQGMAIGAMSVVAPLSAVAAVIPAALDLASGKPVGGLQIAGMGVALAGVGLVSREPGSSRALAAGVPAALVAIAGFGGFYLALDNASAADYGWAAFFARACSFVLLLLAVAVRRQSLAMPARHHYPLLVLIGVLDVGANVLFALATTKGLVGVVSVLTSLYPVVVLGLAALVLHERLAGSQRLGVVAALAGAALISAG